jgi:polo-like kinase 1
MDENKSEEGNENFKSQEDDIIIEKIHTNPDEIHIKKYRKIRLLGKGGFARCYELLDEETQQSFAGKIIKKSSLIKSRTKQKLISEIKIHKSLNHENIVKFERYFEDEENVYIIMELCYNNTLHELLKRRKKLTELETQYYVYYLIKALQYIHSLKIIHRDLKLANLFLTENMQMKLGDFGLAALLRFDGERKRSLCGTPNYMAPEILEGKTGHSFEVDIWSIGIIIYILLIGKPPFETTSAKETLKRIRMKNYSFPQNGIISEPAKELIQNILVLEPHKRPSLKEILESDFMTMGTSIPKTLPQSTLACPPPINFIKQYMPNIGPNGIINNYISKKPQKKFKLDDITQNTAGFSSSKRLFSININNNKNIIIPNMQYKAINNIFFNTSGIFVRKWVESEKYGLGYVLSDDNVGVYCNDKTKIIYKPNGINFIYIENKTHTSHLFTEELNKDLKEKVNLLKNFKGYLFEETKDETKDYVLEGGINIRQFIYVKKFVRTKHAILFRLSNLNVQINFNDNTEIILSKENKMVTYISKKKVISHYPLTIALDSNNKEMTKRLKYTKKILMRMLIMNVENFKNIHDII